MSSAEFFFEAQGADLVVPGGRVLLSELAMRLSTERVAVVGRNGAGKSTFLAALSTPEDTVSWRGRVRASPGYARQVRLVPQALAVHERSPGEERRARLERALRAKNVQLLLLDEPTRDLDEAGVVWLRRRLREWPAGLVVASHDRDLLSDFRDFFVLSETGGRHVHGSLEDLDRVLEAAHAAAERAYLGRIQVLADQEAHYARVSRGRARKKNRGRVNEVDRGNSRASLNGNRSYAQESQGRLRRLRDRRIDEVRSWARAARRSLNPKLRLELVPPDLPAESNAPLLEAAGLSVERDGRSLFEDVHMELNRGDRVGVIGPNGAGKTTLLETLAGVRAGRVGAVHRRAACGWVSQSPSGALDESLLGWLSRTGRAQSPDAWARSLASHRFPLALAERPLATLSPGERLRAVLIEMWHRDPPPEVLLLDEPTANLDWVGARAVEEALRVWPGAWVVASHDRGFLRRLGVTRWVRLGG